MNNSVEKLIKDSIIHMTYGRPSYHIWMAFLTILMLVGMFCYSLQLEHGLSVTGMNDRVSWGLGDSEGLDVSSVQHPNRQYRS